MEAVDVKFLRKWVGYTLIDQNLNTDIRVQINIYHLGNKNRTQEDRLVWIYSYPKDKEKSTSIRTAARRPS